MEKTKFMGSRSPRYKFYILQAELLHRVNIIINYAIWTLQQSDWCIIADISKIRNNNSVVQNFVFNIDYTL